jgi:hypothetical protein
VKDDERIARLLRELRSKLNDEQLDALDALLEHLFSLDPDARRQTCESLMEYLKEIIDNQKPVN